MNEADLTAKEFLTQILSTQSDSIATYEFRGQRVWIKKASRHNPLWLYRIVGAVVWLFGLHTLKPVPSLGGVSAIATEVQRLTELKTKGVNVPSILAHDTEGLMIADFGNDKHPARQLDITLKDSRNDDECLGLFCQAVDAIFDVHQRGAWLSEAFARNIMLDGEGRIGFLDFETEPKDYLSVADCMARDWVFFMFSVAIRLKEHGLMIKGKQYLRQIISQESTEVRQSVLDTCRKLTFFKKLPVEKLGHDGYRLVAMSELFTLND